MNLYDGRKAIDKEITFVDIDEDGKVVYQKTISMREFTDIFTINNCKFLKEFVLSNINDKTWLNVNYGEGINARKKVYKKAL